MVKTGELPGHPEIKANKTQRYACMRRLRKSAKYDAELPALLEAEKQRDYSGDDDLLQIRHQACVLDTAEKQKLFDSYLIEGKWNMYEFDASVSHFYDRGNKEQCEQFAEQWLSKIEFVEANFHRDYFQSFFEALCPTFLRR